MIFIRGGEKFKVSRIRDVYKTEVIYSRYIPLSEVNGFKDEQKDKFEEYNRLKKEGFEISIDIDNEYDGDEFEDGVEVTVVRIEFTAYKRFE